ncbi:MAG: UDP-3-O-(3-hydroxymyristoyl)glucosamine N-acyltransferase [Chloracidobacterium sp.]|nr:UDP-3-O-(3-hydroxymyristoyl)glucosamine N-acyltransferase [Chloracidobacterium sp.]
MKAQEIARLVGGQLTGDGEAEILRISDLERAAAGEIAFVDDSAGTVAASNAACLLIGRDADAAADAVIRVADPKLAFAKVAALLRPPRSYAAERHPSAVVAGSAQIGDGVFVGPFVTVGDGSAIGDRSVLAAGVRIGSNVRIGSDCILHANVVVEDDCVIGNRVALHAGVVIGADGFGYVADQENTHHKFPQIGRVVLGDDVEIGANTCIDRGSLGETSIGDGTKIDNLVQIAHNVRIGKRVVIAAQTGISGSTIIEDDCVIGGQVGIGDHALVKSGAVIGSQAGVLPGKIVRPGIWWGTPIQPLDEYKRQNARVKGLSRLSERVKALEELLTALRDRLG